MTLLIRCDTPGCDAEETLSPWYWPAAPDSEIEDEMGWTVKHEPSLGYVGTRDNPVTARRFYCPDHAPHPPEEQG